MWTLFAVARLVVMLPVLLLGIFLSLFVPLMPRPVYRFVAATWYGTMLALMGVRGRYQGTASEGAVLMVSNHVSFADILVIGARWPYTFLAMHEISRWPVVGWLARRIGTLFIRRGRGAPDAIRQVTDVLRAGRSVIFFPEGRTSYGTGVGRFHPRIFQAAVDARVPVQPVALYYRDRLAEPGAGTRATFADDAGFMACLWRTMAGPPVDVHVIAFEPVGPLEDRVALARGAWELVRGHPGFTADSR